MVGCLVESSNPAGLRRCSFGSRCEGFERENAREKDKSLKYILFSIFETYLRSINELRHFFCCSSRRYVWYFYRIAKLTTFYTDNVYDLRANDEVSSFKAENMDEVAG